MRLSHMQEVPDLSLMIDEQGRLWQFRSTDPSRRLDVEPSVTVAGIDLLVNAPGLSPDTATVTVDSGVLAVRDQDEPAGTIMLPRCFDHDRVATTSRGGLLQIHVPWNSPVETEVEEEAAEMTAA
jgi:hypothetical protein